MRSLVSRKTMDDFDCAPKADPHANGTIWAAALWDLRTTLGRSGDRDAKKCDLLVLKTLLGIGQVTAETNRNTRRMRTDYSQAAAALLRADEALYAGKYRDLIVACLSSRKIAVAVERVSNAPNLLLSWEKGCPA